LPFVARRNKNVSVIFIVVVVSAAAAAAKSAIATFISVRVSFGLSRHMATAVLDEHDIQAIMALPESAQRHLMLIIQNVHSILRCCKRYQALLTLDSAYGAPNPAPCRCSHFGVF
jgi:hypothetical protein